MKQSSEHLRVVTFINNVLFTIVLFVIVDLSSILVYNSMSASQQSL
jgi:hypothetical protein